MSINFFFPYLVFSFPLLDTAYFLIASGSQKETKDERAEINVIVEGEIEDLAEHF